MGIEAIMDYLRYYPSIRMEEARNLPKHHKCSLYSSRDLNRTRQKHYPLNQISRYFIYWRGGNLRFGSQKYVIKPMED
jgi:hypothetical protein